MYFSISIVNFLEVGCVGGNRGSYLVENGNPNVFKVLRLISPRENHLREKM